MFWGITPALDLLQEYQSTKNNLPDELNILIVGSSDARHILQTLARKYRHKDVKLNFFITEACVETIARHLLLLNIALQPQEALGLDQKTKIFMEIYGNSLVRPSVAKYLTSAAHHLIKMVTDYKYMKEMMNFVSLEIKYKERDYLENLFKFWYSKDEFNIIDSWDKRLRKFLGVRYDSKVGAFDWDLHMRLHNLPDGSQVCGQEYRNFRTNGISFSWMESEVSKPNRTLVCAIFPVGEKFAHYGYLGDMHIGPFVSFGLTCEDKNFLKSMHGQNSYRSTDVTERNLKQIFYEIQNKEKYVHRTTNDLQLGPVVMKQEKLVVDVKGVDILPKAMRKCIDLEDRITFLSISLLDFIKYKENYQNFFDIIYYANTYLKHFDKESASKISKNGGLMLIENQLYVLSHRKKELEEFGEKIKEAVGDMNVEKLKFDPQIDAYARFVINH